MTQDDSFTYRPIQDSLRATGHYLDMHDRQLVSLLMVADGIVVTLRPSDVHDVDEAVLLTHDDLRALALDARTARRATAAFQSPDPLFPTGYEDYLRALGDATARQQWTALRLLRIGDAAILHYGPPGSRKELVLTAREIEAILNRAFSQRGRGPLS